MNCTITRKCLRHKRTVSVTMWDRMKLHIGKIVEEIFSARDMKGEESSMPLPEELVEKILAMVSFAQIFKARILSKSWHVRLSSISSQDNEEKKLLAMSFQKRVCDESHKWNTFFPVFVFHDFLIGYDRTSQHWRKFPSLSLLPDREAIKLKNHPRFNASLGGPLLYIRTSRDNIMFVVNILTGSWKELPARPHYDERCGTSERLVASKEMYQVITLYVKVGCASAWIYDSKLGSWRNKRVKLLDIADGFKLAWNDVYLNGVIYGLVYVLHNIWGLLAFDVKAETFTLLQMPHQGGIVDLRYVQMLACSGTVCIIQPYYRRYTFGVFLFEADLVLRRWSKGIRGPPGALKFGPDWGTASSDGDCIFFEGKGIGRKVSAYNVRKDEWSYFPKNRILQRCLGSFRYFNSDTSFQPGMNPFLQA